MGRAPHVGNRRARLRRAWPIYARSDPDERVRYRRGTRRTYGSDMIPWRTPSRRRVVTSSRHHVVTSSRRHVVTSSRSLRSSSRRHDWLRYHVMGPGAAEPRPTVVHVATRGVVNRSDNHRHHAKRRYPFRPSTSSRETSIPVPPINATTRNDDGQASRPAHRIVTNVVLRSPSVGLVNKNLSTVRFRCRYSNPWQILANPGG